MLTKEKLLFRVSISVGRQAERVRPSVNVTFIHDAGSGGLEDNNVWVEFSREFELILLREVDRALRWVDSGIRRMERSDG